MAKLLLFSTYVLLYSGLADTTESRDTIKVFDPLNLYFTTLNNDHTLFAPKPCGILRGKPYHVASDNEVKLTVSPTTIRDGEDVTVTWEGVTDVTHDYLGMSCGPRNVVNDTLEEKMVMNAHSLTFEGLPMMRCNYEFTYFRYSRTTDSYTAVANATVKMHDSFNAPRQCHISLRDNPSEMVVMWNSASNRTPVVKYSLSSSGNHWMQEGTSTTYAASDMCHMPANVTSQKLFRDPGYIHTVLLEGLQSDTIYYYRVGNSDDGWSEQFKFRSRPYGNNRRMTAGFIAYADMGTWPNSRVTASRVSNDVQNGYDDFLLHIGDVSYARGRAHIWDKFFHLIQQYAAQVPYMVSIGNHEYDYIMGGEQDPSGTGGKPFRPIWGNYGEDSAGECSVPMIHRWNATSNRNSIYWYSFNHASVHVVQISSEHNWTRGSEQYKWLEADLAAVNRTETPFVILTAHRMMYTTQLKQDMDQQVAEHFRDNIEYLLVTYKVNLMLTGHQHSYERTCPVKQKECQQDGTVHIIIGTAGAALETSGFSNFRGSWSLSHIQQYGYLRGNVSAESMHLQFVESPSGNVFDDITIYPWNTQISMTA